MSQNGLNFSEKAQHIEKARGKYWEWFLCAQLIEDEIGAVKALVEYGSDSSCDKQSGRKAIRNINDLEEILGNLRSEVPMLNRFTAILSEVSPGNVDVFGPVGQPGNPAAIMLLARKFGNIYHEITVSLNKSEAEALFFQNFFKRDIDDQSKRLTPITDALRAVNAWLISNLNNLKYYLENFGNMLVTKIKENLEGSPNVNSSIGFAISSSDHEIELIKRASQVLTEWRNEGVAFFNVNDRNHEILEAIKKVNNIKLHARQVAEEEQVDTSEIDDLSDKMLATLMKELHSEEFASELGSDVKSNTFTSLFEFFEWIESQENISMAAMRKCLLPLDLFPGAIIDDINEKALDIAGEYALEEVGDQVVVNRTVFSQVISKWDRLT